MQPSKGKKLGGSARGAMPGLSRCAKTRMEPIQAPIQGTNPGRTHDGVAVAHDYAVGNDLRQNNVLFFCPLHCLLITCYYSRDHKSARQHTTTALLHTVRAWSPHANGAVVWEFSALAPLRCSSLAGAGVGCSGNAVTYPQRQTLPDGMQNYVKLSVTEHDPPARPSTGPS